MPLLISRVSNELIWIQKLFIQTCLGKIQSKVSIRLIPLHLPYQQTWWRSSKHSLPHKPDKIKSPPQTKLLPCLIVHCQQEVPHKQSEAVAAVVLSVAMSETERLIYDCCWAAGLFLSQLHCAAAYLRLCLQLMDDWSRPPTAPRREGEGGRRGRGESGGPPVVEHKPTDLRHATRPKTPQADKKQHAALHPPAAGCKLFPTSSFASVCRGSPVCYTQRFSVNSVFYHH